jgi:hypothetical protein
MIKQQRKSRGDADDSRSVSPWIVVILLGFVVRFVVAYASIGSDDAAMFWVFGNHVRSSGLFGAYRENPQFNHPPISAFLACGTLAVTEQIAGPTRPPTPDDEGNWFEHMALFVLLFKLPAIAADALACALLYAVWRSRSGSSSARWVVPAAYAWALGPILVSSYHGNTDSIYAAFSLAAAWLMHGERRRPFLGGLALAVAINIKLIPVLLIPILAVSVHSRRELLLFFAGLGVGVIPYLPVLYWDLLISERSYFTRNVLAYNPEPNSWGLAIPLTVGRPHPPRVGFDDLLLSFKANGRYLILASVAAWTLLWRRASARRDLLLGAAVVYALFLVLVPGFGVQYVVIVAPLLFAAGQRWLATGYGLASGLCAGSAYVAYLQPGLPMFSKFKDYFPPATVIFGVVAWSLLVVFVFRSVRDVIRERSVTSQPTLPAK